MNKIEVLGGFAIGKFGTMLLVSARKLPPDAPGRAKAFGIDVLNGVIITRLEEYVRAWMCGQNIGRP